MKFNPPHDNESWRRYTNREAKRLQVSRRRVLRMMAKEAHRK